MLATFLKGALTRTGIQYVGGSVQSSLGTTTNITVSLTSLSGGLAAAPSQGDLVIIYFATGSQTNRDLVVSGYTEVVELYSNSDGGNDTNLVVAYKFMGATPDTTATLTGGTGNSDDAGAVAVQVWRGVNSTTPMDVTRTTATGIETILCNPPAITPVTSGAVIVSGGAGSDAENTPALYTSTNLTGFISGAQNDFYTVTIGLGYHMWASGSFDPAQFEYGSPDDFQNSWAAVTLALRPA